MTEQSSPVGATVVDHIEESLEDSASVQSSDSRWEASRKPERELVTL
jgi:hypothetical protein